MHRTQLRKVGGSVMLTVPPAILDQLQLKAGSAIGLAVDGDRLILQPQKHRYTLAELLDEADFPKKRSKKDALWGNAPAVGRELL